MPNAKNIYILNGTEDFVRGEMDNVALVDNALCLEQMAGRSVLYGCYTSQIISFPNFCRLVLSWNAETPEGTVVEAQARVLDGENWSPWFSFGRWSPFIQRASNTQPEGLAPYVNGGVVEVPSGRASQAQLRMYLYTDNERVSPAVRLLGASVQPSDWKEEEAKPYGRLLRLPAYSQIGRDPELQKDMENGTALTSLLNRQGQDALPEEMTLGMFDYGRKDCRNHSFAVALAGACGFEAYLAYLDPQSVWEHVKAGESVAVELNYSTDEQNEELTGLPILPGSLANGIHQLMPLRGFELDHEGRVFALVNDSHAASDRAAEKSYPVEDLWKVYSGLAVLVRGFHKNKLNAAPMRRHMSMRPLTWAGSYMFQTSDGTDIPVGQDFKGSLCCTVRDGVAHATTAHKAFRYLSATEEGGVQIPEELRQPGSKITVYLIRTSGNTLVGDINL